MMTIRARRSVGQSIKWKIKRWVKGTGLTQPVPPRSGLVQRDLSNIHTYHQNKWLLALKCVLPVYLITHALFALLTLFAPLFILDNFSSNSLPLSTLWKSWEQWDTAHYRDIAKYGYDQPWRAAFFPLYPLLERYGAYFTRDPFIAGLIISNVSGLIGMTDPLSARQRGFWGGSSCQCCALFLYLSPRILPRSCIHGVAFPLPRPAQLLSHTTRQLLASWPVWPFRWSHSIAWYFFALSLSLSNATSENISV